MNRYSVMNPARKQHKSQLANLEVACSLALVQLIF